MFKPLTPAELYKKQLSKLSKYKNKKSKEKAKVRFKDDRIENKAKIKKYNIYQTDIKRRDKYIKNNTQSTKAKVKLEWERYQERKKKNPKKAEKLLKNSRLKIDTIQSKGKMKKEEIKDNFNTLYIPIQYKGNTIHRNNTKDTYIINDIVNWRFHLDDLISKHKDAHNIIVGQKINYSHDVTNLISESYTRNELIDEVLMGSDLFEEQLKNTDKSKYHISIKKTVYFVSFYKKNEQ